jgi:DNA helicase-2/ATP-dependent DNA helicase PcrA
MKKIALVAFAAACLAVPALAQQPAPAGPPVQRFHEGDRVNHPKFGKGVVMKSTLTRTDEELVVRFDAAGVKILNGTIAPLTKL